MVSPNRAQEPQCPPTVRQGSLYNLTFDEAQSQLGNTGKPLHSMNLDELLKNVISAESGQLVQNPSSDSFLIGNTDLNGTLSNKTLNEVWREIVHQGHVNRSGDNNLQQSMLGETTLQDFLARAGVINMGNGQDNDVMGDAQPLMTMDPIVMASQPEDWLPLQMQMQMQMPSIHIHQQQYQDQQHQQIIGLCPDFSVPKSVYETPVMEIDYSENSMAISMPMVSTMSMSPTCSDSKGAAIIGRKHRYSDEMLEKTIERRQKRMAKNRESAARSRAKKQEHINKLQKDKSRLEKTNSWLKKLKEVDAQLSSATTLTPKYQLRRTSSTTF